MFFLKMMKIVNIFIIRTLFKGSCESLVGALDILIHNFIFGLCYYICSLLGLPMCLTEYFPRMYLDRSQSFSIFCLRKSEPSYTPLLQRLVFVLLYTDNATSTIYGRHGRPFPNTQQNNFLAASKRRNKS